jgi:hypothetical protein
VRATAGYTHTVLHDPAVRRAYVLTKVAVFAVATAVTWPLAKMFGPRAWWGLAVFGVALLVITVTVLVACRFGQVAESEEESGAEAESEPFADPDQPVKLTVEDRIDLHSFEPRDVPNVVADYLTAAHARGFREVRLIHGRGIGVQRERVRSLLARHPLVDQFHDAPADRGGWGATVAYLKRG